ncbi:tubulin binding cofactor C-domain-containing protein [Linnemannia elongata]|nr:tubulin binding cofactor C-domain-containing protein [Linnemannia elongata]
MSEVTKENFRASFDPKRVEVERDLDNLPNVPKTQIQAAVDNLVQRIQLLEKAVTDNISILPPYDTRICLEAVKSASERLSVLRGQLVPRQKFSFKSRKTVATATSPSALQVSNAATSATANQSTVDTSLFMTFENRTGEYLFIGALQVPNAIAQHDASSPSPSAMMVDTETIYLGGVQVINNTTASAPAVIEKPKDVALTNLTDCTINLVHTLPLGAIHIKNLKRCVLVIPPVSGSILLHDCEGCTLIGACHQSRMHTSTNMDIYLHVTSEPIIEDCTDMRFAPYPYEEVLPSDQLLTLFVAAGLRPEKNLFDHVKDFNWLRQQQSPNWRLLDASEIRQGVAHHVLYTQRA